MGWGECTIGEMDARSKLVFTRRRSTVVARFIAFAPSTQHSQRLSAVFHVFRGSLCTVCCTMKTRLLTDVVWNKEDAGFWWWGVPSPTLQKWIVKGCFKLLSIHPFSKPTSCCIYLIKAFIGWREGYTLDKFLVHNTATHTHNLEFPVTSSPPDFSKFFCQFGKSSPTPSPAPSPWVYNSQKGFLPLHQADCHVLCAPFFFTVSKNYKFISLVWVSLQNKM